MKVDPDLPPHWGEVRLSFVWRKVWFDLSITHDRVNMTAYHQGDRALPVEIFGKPYTLRPGMTVEAVRQETLRD
nr:glycosyl hydrolase family 65 protein [Pseudodesulfovibrio aespoeensis]